MGRMWTRVWVVQQSVQHGEATISQKQKVYRVDGKVECKRQGESCHQVMQCDWCMQVELQAIMVGWQ